MRKPRTFFRSFLDGFTGAGLVGGLSFDERPLFDYLSSTAPAPNSSGLNLRLDPK